MTAESWEKIKAKTNLPSRTAVLEFAVGLSMQTPGAVVEFGVGTGGSTRTIRGALNRAASDKKFFAFDWFQGLPEPYESLPAGALACVPPEIAGVEIVNGLFKDTLTAEMAARIGRVSFAHLDADLYSSTLLALRFLTPLLETGSLLLFDEFTSNGADERRAFEQWQSEEGIHALRVAEFTRPPCADGAPVDVRALFQLIGSELLPDREAEIAVPAAAFRRDYITRADIAGPGVELGSGWYPLEEYDGEAFRWVATGATVSVRSPGTICALVEPGPGAGGLPLAVQAGGDRFLLTGRQEIRFAAQSGARYEFVVEGGGRPSPGDPRTLNFRVFRLWTV